MPFFDTRLVTLFLAISGSLATPTGKPSKVQRDKKPEPSQYPLDKPCENEWSYLNFDPHNDVDKQHLRQLHTAICNDITRILPHALDSSSNINIIFARYFGIEGEDADGGVTSAYNRVFDYGKLTPLVRSFVIDNKDFNQDKDAASCSDPNNYAYTDKDENDAREKIHICDPAWKKPDLDSIQCENLDKYASFKMDTFSRIAVHEIFHYSSVGPKSTLGVLIRDNDNRDGIVAYFPKRAHGLADELQDDQAGIAEGNADNYAWLAMDSYFSVHCSKNSDDYQHYFQDPPHYTLGEPPSDGES